MVKIQIRDRNVEVTDDLRSHVARRLGFELARFGERIARVIVRFSDARGDSGADRRCQIHVGLGSRSARVEETNTDSFIALDCAAERVCRSVVRVLDREREWISATGAQTSEP